MQAIAQDALDEFQRRLFAHLRQLESTAPLSDGQLREQLTRGVASACRFFKTESAVARYCEIVLAHLGGWTDDDHPEAALRMLRTTVVDPAARLRNFELWITANSGKPVDAR